MSSFFFFYHTKTVVENCYKCLDFSLSNRLVNLMFQNSWVRFFAFDQQQPKTNTADM